jgi:histidine triad (HIT) family protein
MKLKGKDKMPTIFTKIINREIPANIVYETDDVLAFKDIDPKAPVHILIIPKKVEIPKVTDIKGEEHGELLGKMFDAANKIAMDTGIDKDGFRLVINCGSNAGQAVYHLHMHLLGGRQMSWPPG